MAVALSQALLVKGAVAEHALREALFVSVTRGVPFAAALVETGAIPPQVLESHLAATKGPTLQRVVPLAEAMERLPPGLAARLLAVPVRRDAITGTVDVAVPDPRDAHGAEEIGYHLGASVRVVRASLAAIEEALHRRSRPSKPPGRMTLPPGPLGAPPPPDTPRDLEYDSRPTLADHLERSPASQPLTGSLPPPPPVPGELRASAAPARVSPAPAPRISAPPPAGASVRPGRPPMKTPPWGSPVHIPKTEPPMSGFGSEIPIPLTRRAPLAGGTQRPPPMQHPEERGLGTGYPVDPESLRSIVEVDRSKPPAPVPLPAEGGFAAYAPQLPFAEATDVLDAIRAAGDRDAVLELVLTGARMVAGRVAVFVVKQGAFVGWSCTPELGDLAALRAVRIAVDAETALSQAVHEGTYLGPLRHDDLHAPLLRVMRASSRDVAIVPVRVTGRTVAVVLADALGDTMLSTRRIEELVHAAGEAFTRIVRHRK